MEISILLGKIASIYLIVVGISLLVRQKSWMAVIKDFRTKPGTLMFVAFLELVLGLIIVITHNVWVTDWAVVVTIIGWLMVIEGIVYMVVPHSVTSRMIKYFNKPTWYVAGGIFSILVGVYLASFAFGLNLI